MSLSVGIVGLPNVGKSTLFNALMQREIASVGHHPFTTVSPNRGIVVVPDGRLKKLVGMVEKGGGSSVEIDPPKITFVDIAGLVKGAHQGEGLGNRFLSHIREVDLMLHVLREFNSSQVPHVAGRVDPTADASTVNLELILADFEVVVKSIKEREKKSRTNKKANQEIEVLEKLKEVLDEGKPALVADLDEGEEKLLGSFNFLTLKPSVYILNVSESWLEEEDFPKDKLPEGIIIPVCIKLAADLFQLDDKERGDYLSTVGVKSTGLDQVIKTAYKTLRLITFYTVKGNKKVSGWSIKEGTPAVKAAGKIHSDFEKRFIKAEVIDWRQLVRAGSWQAAKEKGLLQLKGRDYKIKDGEVVEFKFN